MPLVTVFLAGDVMTGRGIDQVLRCPSDPGLREPYVGDAREYVELAEERNGPIVRSADDRYIWGDALDELRRLAPAARIINLETSVTRANAYWPGKEIHYRMHPANVGCLAAAHIDVCVLANNHVLDFGRPGLLETLDTLARAGIRTAGAGSNLGTAQTPALVPLPDGRQLILGALGSTTSGIPQLWAAEEHQPGINLLGDLSDETARSVGRRLRTFKRPGDLVVASIHWGSNWGYEVPDSQIRFAHALVDEGVDLVHGHSSHHPRPIERYRDRLILYGCGDLLNDYEGIAGDEQFRGDLALMYFATMDPDTGGLVQLSMTPMRIRRFRLGRAAAPEVEWLCETLDRISTPFGSQVALGEDGRLDLRPPTTHAGLPPEP